MDGISIILPANNEAALIGPCLAALFASKSVAVPVEVIVVANGCSDDTAPVARACDKQTPKGWRFDVLELAEGGKLNALNQGDATAQFGARAYLDADVMVSSGLLGELVEILSLDAPLYASGQVQIVAGKSAFSRAYARAYARVPFMTEGVPGCGLFAVNAQGRARWGAFPDIISDDTFVRLQFAPSERVGAAASYRWPVVEGFENLVKTRQRQDNGVIEVAAHYPELMANEGKGKLGLLGVFALALRDPLGMIAYASVALAVRLSKGQGDTKWSRGR